MIVVVQKEIFDAVVLREPAALVKRHGQRAVTRADEHGVPLPAVLLHHVFDQRPAVPLAVQRRVRRDVLDLVDPVIDLADHALAHDLRVLRKIHLALAQVPVDHILLLIGEQQQGKIVLFVPHDPFKFHVILQKCAIRRVFLSLTHPARSVKPSFFRKTTAGRLAKSASRIPVRLRSAARRTGTARPTPGTAGRCRSYPRRRTDRKARSDTAGRSAAG